MATLKKNKKLYWALIGTFIFLWLAVAFVSTLHAISFFQITNTLGLAILLGTAYEIGQASVLFSILMTENKNRLLAWSMLIILTALQVTANVYASFKFMETSGLSDWEFWQKSVLFGVQAADPEMYKIIISWISGALLPIVALGMTSLVADNIAMVRAEKLEEVEDDTLTPERADEIIENEVQKRMDERLQESLSGNIKDEKEIISPVGNVNYDDDDDEFEVMGDLIVDTPIIVKEPVQVEKKEEAKETPVKEEPKPEPKPVPEPETKPKVTKEEKIEPSNKPRGWHFKNEFIDDEGKVFKKGKYSHTITQDKKESSKKA